MSKLLTKARAGVTLVELLVVILIVTILSVSLLPLLKPYIEEAKYTAEPIPVLANMQTKINLYQYEKDYLPGEGTSNSNGDVQVIATWEKDSSDDTTPKFNRAFSDLGSTTVQTSTTNTYAHFAEKIDVDWQDLLGRRMNPTHFKYALLKGDGASKYGYAIGVFGDGNGLGKGTGYAVLTIVDTSATRQAKIVGTWRRYKPKGNDTAVSFNIATGAPNNEDDYCYLPSYDDAFVNGVDSLITYLTQAGWEINEEAFK